MSEQPISETVCLGNDGGIPRGLGLVFSTEGDMVVSTFAPRAVHAGVPGQLHGGVAATALDETMAAVGLHLDGIPLVTASLRLRYRRPVPIPLGDVRIEAWRTRNAPGRRQRICARLMLPDGTVAVDGEGLFVQSVAASLRPQIPVRVVAG